MGCSLEIVYRAKLIVALKSLAKNITVTSQIKMTQNTKIIKNLVTLRKSMRLSFCYGNWVVTAVYIIIFIIFLNNSSPVFKTLGAVFIESIRMGFYEVMNP